MDKDRKEVCIDGVPIPMMSLRLETDIPMFGNKRMTEKRDIIESIGEYIGMLPKEVVMIVCLNSEGAPICVSLIGMGTDTQCPIPVHDIMKIALLSNATNLIIIHNHPSQISTNEIKLKFSKADIDFTASIIKACSIMGIGLYDSYIATEIKKKDNKSQIVMKSARWGIGAPIGLTYPKSKDYTNSVKNVPKELKDIVWDPEEAAKIYNLPVSDEKVDTVSMTAYTKEELGYITEIMSNGEERDNMIKIAKENMEDNGKVIENITPAIEKIVEETNNENISLQENKEEKPKEVINVLEIMKNFNVEYYNSKDNFILGDISKEFIKNSNETDSYLVAERNNNDFIFGIEHNYSNGESYTETIDIQDNIKEFVLYQLDEFIKANEGKTD